MQSAISTDPVEPREDMTSGEVGRVREMERGKGVVALSNKWSGLEVYMESLETGDHPNRGETQLGLPFLGGVEPQLVPALPGSVL